MKTDNSVELLGYYGSDTVIACSAWISTSRNLTEDKKSRIPKLISNLWGAEPVSHKSPFEKGIVHFLVNTDIATHIHLLKHRISSINAESARYKELKEDKYYIPDDWKGIKVDHEKLSPLAYNIFQSEENWVDVLGTFTNLGNEMYHKCLEDLTPTLGRKRAKESARYFKMYNSQIEADIMFNMSSFHNFINQRMDGHAQKEVREVARNMVNTIKSIEGNPFEHTLKAWNI